MKQLHDRMVFTPIRKEDLTREEIKRALESLIFLVICAMVVLKLVPERMEVRNASILQERKRQVRQRLQKQFL